MVSCTQCDRQPCWDVQIAWRDVMDNMLQHSCCWQGPGGATSQCTIAKSLQAPAASPLLPVIWSAVHGTNSSSLFVLLAGKTLCCILRHTG
jgi:hypothetical protein